MVASAADFMPTIGERCDGSYNQASAQQIDRNSGELPAAPVDRIMQLGAFRQAELMPCQQRLTSIHLLNIVWMRSLIRWLKAPLKFPCPMAVDFGLVLCDHNELIVDFNLPAERGNLTVLSSPEWTSLLSYEP